MAKALIVSSAFPPLGAAGGSIRLVKFLKFMSDWDWQFIVFTQDIQRTIVPEQLLSHFLLKDLPADLSIQRVAAPFTSPGTDVKEPGFDRSINIIFKKIVGDSALPWGLRVFWNGLVCLGKGEIDIIFGTAPPFTNALITMLLSWAGRKPFVIDLRDDWVGLPIFLRKSVVRQKLEIFLESLIISRASAIITVTRQSHDLYKERYARLGKPEKFHLIPNGCDLDEYNYLGNRERKIASDQFLILSAGWWYRKGHRDISPFLVGLDMFFKRRPEARKKVDVVMLGNSLGAEYDQLLADLNLEKIIQRLGAVGRGELVEWLWKADLLLLVQPINNTTAISGTLYEYWATGKAPILLISEKGASSGLVEDHHLGQHFHFEHIEQIADYLETMFDAYQAGQPVWIEREGIQNFDRKVLAKQMMEIWQDVLSHARRL